MALQSTFSIMAASESRWTDCPTGSTAPSARLLSAVEDPANTMARSRGHGPIIAIVTTRVVGNAFRIAAVWLWALRERIGDGRVDDHVIPWGCDHGIPQSALRMKV